MDAEKIQFLQKACKACKFVEALETNAKKDLEKDFRSSSVNNCPLDNDNANVLVLSQKEVDKQKNDLEQSQTKVRFLEKKLSMALEIIAEQKAKLDGFENQGVEIERLKKTNAILQKAYDESNNLNLENMELDQLKERKLLETIERLNKKTKELSTDLVIKVKQAETIRIENETLQRELNSTLKSLLKVQQEELKSTQDQHTIEVKYLKQKIQTLEEKLEKARNPHSKENNTKQLFTPLNENYEIGNNELHFAAKEGLSYVANILLQNGADVNKNN